MLYPIINRKSPLKIEFSKLIYLTILRPVLTYGCVIWGTATKTHINKTQIFQNKVLRLIVDAPWFVRNNQIHKELGILKIDQFIKNCALNFFDKINSCSGAVYYNLSNNPTPRRLKRKLSIDLVT